MEFWFLATVALAFGLLSWVLFSCYHCEPVL